MDLWQLATATATLATMASGALLLTARRKLAVADLRRHHLEQELEAAGCQQRQLEQDLEAALAQLRMVEDVDRYREDHARQSVALQELQAEIDGRNGRLLTLQAEIESRTTERDVLDQSVHDADQRLRDASQQLDGLREQINQAGSDLAAAIQAVADSRLSIERHRIAAAIALKGAVDASAEECRQNAAKVVELQGLQSSLRDWYAEKKVVYDDLCREVDKLNDKIDFVEMGHFDVKLSYDSSAAYVQAISDLKERQKVMIAAGEAVVCTTNWTINGSLTEGKLPPRRPLRKRPGKSRRWPRREPSLRLQRQLNASYWSSASRIWRSGSPRPET